MSRRFSLLFVVLAWAAIYLPGLGSMEFRGEEGRRVLPAVAMLETGNWLVPQIAGRPYFRKPPLVNWLIASSFQVTGSRAEWAARLPSVLSLLAVALMIAGAARTWLGAERALASALLTLTMVAMIDKGRLAEIEAVYVSLTGIAMVLWLSARGRWAIWVPPFAFLGLAMLAKGPVHLLFFYGLVVAVLLVEKRIRELFSGPHLVGVLLMLAIFLAWAFPYWEATRGLGAADVWREQMQERVGGGSFDFGSWLLNFPRALSNALPWVVAVPWLWSRRRLAALPERQERLVRGLRGPVLALAFGLMLIPGMLPRYSMPMLIPLALCLAMIWPSEFLRWIPRATALIGLIVIAGSFFLARLPSENARPVGRAITAAVPAGARLYAGDIGFFAPLLYVERPYDYLLRTKDAPAAAEYFLVQAREFPKLQEEGWAPRELARVEDRSGKKFLVLQRTPAATKMSASKPSA